ncbi:MAG: nuclear transport factor 2 family protein [Terricaulis sp.]
MDWFIGYLRNVDARAIDDVLATIHDNCVIQVNDQLPAFSKAAIARGLELYYEAFENVEHEVLNVYGQDHNFATELLLHYTPLNGKRTTMPAAVLYDRDAVGLIISMRIFVSAGSMLEAFVCAAR